MVVSPKLSAELPAGCSRAHCGQPRRPTQPEGGGAEFGALTASRPATAASGPWAFGSFRMVNVVPDLLLSEIEKHGQHDEKDEHLEAEPLALIEFGLSRPHQEG